jgi:hypothetical protein
MFKYYLVVMKCMPQNYTDRKGHTLIHPNYFEALKIISDELNFWKIPYAIVGGCATQIWLSDAVGKGEPINDVSELKYLLRPTKDVDLIAQKPELFYQAMNTLAANYSRKGGWRFNIGHAGTKLTRGNDAINFSYITDAATSGLKAVYKDFIEKAEEVELKRSSMIAKPRVLIPEHLVAAKLTAEANQEKHLGDVSNLLRVLKTAGQRFDDEDVRSLIKTLGKYDKLETLDSILASLK